MFSLKTCIDSPKNTRKKAVLLILTVTVLSMVLMGAVYDTSSKDIDIILSDDFSGIDTVKTVTTDKAVVADVLAEAGIELSGTEVVEPLLSDDVSDGDKIYVYSGRNVTIEYDGITLKTVTTKKRVYDTLLRAGVKVNKGDILSPSHDSIVSENEVIKLTRVTEEEYTAVEPILFKELVVKDPAMYVDEKIVKIEGKNGSKEVDYAAVYHDGVEYSKTVISETVIEEPVNRLVVVGTKERVKTYKGYKYSRVLNVTCTAYEPYNCGGDGRGITASGLKAQFGVVAVDPRVIPLGTKLYIESPDGGKSWTYGYCIAADTGGAIKGNKIDLCYNTVGECIQFGRRSATVYVLD